MAGSKVFPASTSSFRSRRPDLAKVRTGPDDEVEGDVHARTGLLAVAWLAAPGTDATRGWIKIGFDGKADS